MRKYLIALSLYILMISGCKTGNQDSDMQKNVTPRNYSITAANAFSDIFLDSNTVAAFIDTLQADEIVKWRILSFYNARNYQYAWFSSEGLNEDARGFWNLYQYDLIHHSDSLKSNKKLTNRMEDLFASSYTSISVDNKAIRNAELQLTQYLIAHTLEVKDDKSFKRQEMEHFIPVKKENFIELADSVMTNKRDDDKYFNEVNEAYRKLKSE